MIGFGATYFDGRSSAARPVRVTADGSRLHLTGAGLAGLEVALADCDFSPPLGSTSRVIRLPGNGRLESDELAAVAELEALLGRNRGMQVVNLFERYWPAVAVCFVGLVAAVWLFTVHGIPLAADWLARALPASLTEKVSQQTLALLDEQLLAASELDGARVAALQGEFARAAAELGHGFDYRFMLRKGGEQIGPNAFALPSGIIIMTDELVALAEHDEELIGVMAHEIGHVENRHGLRSIFQNAGVFLIISGLVGDISSITSTAASLPTLLAQTGYSRQFERESDRFAGHYCIERGWGTQPMVTMLEKLDSQAKELPGGSLLSTHPGGSERVEALRQLTP